MNTLITVLIYTAGIGLVWLLPLHYVCKWAEREKKDHRIVAVVGLLTGWVIGLIVALLLPRLNDEEFTAIGRKSEREPMGETAIILGGMGVCSVFALGFMAWMKWGI